MVENIDIIQDASKTHQAAYVKFSMVDDVEIAIKRNDQKSNIRIFRASNDQMKSVGSDDLPQSAQATPKPSRCSTPHRSQIRAHQAQGASVKTDIDPNSHKKILNPRKYLKIHGLERTDEKDFVMSLFQGNF